MVYIVGDDTGSGGNKYFVSYMIYEEGVPYLRSRIKQVIDGITKIIGCFDRFHFRNLLNDFYAVGDNKKVLFSCENGLIENSVEGIIEGVVTFFKDTLEEFIKKEYILPQVFVVKKDVYSWKYALEDGCASMMAKVKKAEKILPVICFNKCIQYLRDEDIDDDVICIADRTHGDSVEKPGLRYSSMGEMVEIQFKSSISEPLLQMADFLAYTYNRNQTKGSDDLFNKNASSVLKYYRE